MASPVKIYQREMHKRLGFFPTWLPGDPIEIGDVGLLNAGRFRRMTSLNELSIPCEIATGPTKQDVQLTSSNGTKLTTAGGISASASIRAEITVEFSRAGAFIFNASTLRPQYLVNRSEVTTGILEAFKAERWERNWVLVDSLHIADRATIIVSEEDSARITLVAENAGTLQGISLADPRFNFAVVSTRGSMVHVVSGRNLHPLYSCLGLKVNFFGKTAIQPVRRIDANRLRRSLSRLVSLTLCHLSIFCQVA